RRAAGGSGQGPEQWRQRQDRPRRGGTAGPPCVAGAGAASRAGHALTTTARSGVAPGGRAVQVLPGRPPSPATPWVAAEVSFYPRPAETTRDWLSAELPRRFATDRHTSEGGARPGEFSQLSSAGYPRHSR